MAAHSKIPVSPINISSQSPSPQAIDISSDPPAPDPGRPTRAAYWTPAPPACYPSEVPSFSRAPSVFSVRSSIPDADLAMGIKLRDLRNRCAELEAKNGELEGQVAAWS